MIRLTDAPIDHATLVEGVRSDQAGAICVFLGTVRELTGERRTVALDYEAFPEMALRKLEGLEEEARRRWPILDVSLIHRLGHLGLGEVCVGVAVSCPHRHQAFDACRWLIDAPEGVRPHLEEGALGGPHRILDPPGSPDHPPGRGVSGG